VVVSPAKTVSLGNVYTVGDFRGTADFDPGGGTFNLVSGGDRDIFISKIDASGNFVWAKRLGGTNEQFAYGVTADASGNVYVTGSFEGTTDFDPGVGTLNFTAAGGLDQYVIKLDVSGDLVWARQLGGGTSYGYSIAVDGSGNVHTAGQFAGTIDFDPGGGTFNISSSGTNAFVSKLNAAGNFEWAKKLTGVSGVFGRSVGVDGFGNVYSTGFFQGTADFDPDTSAADTFNLTAVLYDIFVSKLNSSGDFQWAKMMGGDYNNEANGISVDAIGNAYTTGEFKGTVDFDPGVGTVNLTGVGTGTDAFVSKLDSAGDFVWVKQFGGSSSSDKVGRGIEVDDQGNVHTTGTYYGTVDFDPGPDVFNLLSIGRSNFVHKMMFNCSNITSTLNPTACDTYTVPSGDETYTATGTYMDTVSNGGSCENVITINLTISSGSANTINPTACDTYTVPSGDETHTTTGTYMDTVPNSGGCDSVLTINLIIDNSSTSTINPGVCDSYTVPSGDETYTVAGTYSDTIPNALGCDSVITINLSINSTSNTINPTTTLSPAQIARVWLTVMIESTVRLVVTVLSHPVDAANTSI